MFYPPLSFGAPPFVFLLTLLGEYAYGKQLIVLTGTHWGSLPVQFYSVTAPYFFRKHALSWVSASCKLSENGLSGPSPKLGTVGTGLFRKGIKVRNSQGIPRQKIKGMPSEPRVQDFHSSRNHYILNSKTIKSWNCNCWKFSKIPERNSFLQLHSARKTRKL